MSPGKDEAVPIGPLRATCVVPHHSGEEGVGQWRQRHGCSRVPGIGLLGCVHGETADDVDGASFDSAVGHGRTLVVVPTDVD